MTRFALLGCLALVALNAVAEDKKDVPKELAPFQGEWKVVSATFGGMPAPKEKIEGAGFTFDGEKLIANEKGGKPDAGSYTIDPKADPAAIDLVSPNGEKVPGIYKFDKDGKLTLMFTRGKDAARPKGFDDKDAVVLVLEKVKK